MDEIIPHLRNSDVVVRQNILSALDHVAEEDPDSHPIIEAIVRAQLFGFPSSFGPEESVSVIETFENSVLYDREQSTRIFIRAGGFEYVINELGSPSVTVRTAASSCLSVTFDISDLVDEEQRKITASGGELPAKMLILCSFIQAIQDEDDGVALSAVEFLSATEGDEARLLILEFPDAIVSLILLYGRKSLHTFGSSSEMALVKFCEGEGKQIMAEGFRNLWKSGDIAFNRRMDVAACLANSFLEILTAALEGGLCDFILQSLTMKNRHAV